MLPCTSPQATPHPTAPICHAPTPCHATARKLMGAAGYRPKAPKYRPRPRRHRVCKKICKRKRVCPRRRRHHKHRRPCKVVFVCKRKCFWV